MSHACNRRMLIWSLMWVLLASLAGCHSPMALKPGNEPLDTSKKSIAIFVLRVQNSATWEAFQPSAKWLEVHNETSSSNESFALYEPCNPYEDTFREHLVSVALEPGTYTIRDVFGMAIIDPSGMGLSPASFQFPLGGKFVLPPNQVVYLGYASMTNRPRVGDEPRSGSVFPIIPQSVAGFSRGTMDITITDRSATDIPLFTKTYPSLAGQQIGKAILIRN